MLHPNGQLREDVQEKRKKHKKHQPNLDVSKLKFIDQSSINCGMTRLYGRAPSNERVNDYVPDVRFERTSVIAALGLEGITAPLAFKGTLNAEFFQGWVEQVLAPTLSFGDIVFLDNYSVHKVAGVLEPIYARGATPVFLPQYSPDLNPIELMWSKVKSVLRKLKPRTFDELMESLKQALDSVTYDDIVGWFKHHGYILNN
jgi:transposase